VSSPDLGAGAPRKSQIIADGAPLDRRTRGVSDAGYRRTFGVFGLLRGQSPLMVLRSQTGPEAWPAHCESGVGRDAAVPFFLYSTPGARDRPPVEDPPHVSWCPPMTEQPDGLLAEVAETRIAPRVVERHIRLWRVTSQSHAASRVPSSLAHEALSEAGRAIDRIAEMLRREIKATSTQTTPDYSVAMPPLPANGANPELGEEPT
jgi:hypothetical protein